MKTAISTLLLTILFLPAFAQAQVIPSTAPVGKPPKEKAKKFHEKEARKLAKQERIKKRAKKTPKTAKSASKTSKNLVIADHIITVTDDFVVDVFHNGDLVPDSKRGQLLDRFGASVERINIDVRRGDTIVFNVVNNRLRWGGAYYFAVAGRARDEITFVSETKTGQWTFCDDPGKAPWVIASRKKMEYVEQPAVKPTRPWHEGDKFMRQYAGKLWNGSPVWGKTRNTWIKFRVK